MADVEDHATCPRRGHVRFDRAIWRHRAVRLRAEAMGQDISAPHALHHFGPVRRRVVQMRHHAQPGGLGHAQGQVQRHDAALARAVAAEPDLDADHDIRVLARRIQAGLRVQQSELRRLAVREVAAEREDAGEGDVQERQDAHLRPLDHVAAEPRDIAGAGGPGVDHRGDAAGPGIGVRVHAERGAAPIHVGVQIDQAGHHHAAGDIPHIARRAEILADGGHFSLGECDVGHGIVVLRGVENPSPGQDQVMQAVAPGFPRRAGRRMLITKQWGQSVKAGRT